MKKGEVLVIKQQAQHEPITQLTNTVESGGEHTEPTVLERIANANRDLSDEGIELPTLKSQAYEAHRQAEQKWHTYAVSLPLGEDRIYAFGVYGKIRHATLKF